MITHWVQNWFKNSLDHFQSTTQAGPNLLSWIIVSLGHREITEISQVYWPRPSGCPEIQAKNEGGPSFFSCGTILVFKNTVYNTESVASLKKLLQTHLFS